MFLLLSLYILPLLCPSLPCGWAGVRAILFSVLDRRNGLILCWSAKVRAITLHSNTTVDVQEKLTDLPFKWYKNNIERQKAWSIFASTASVWSTALSQFHTAFYILLLIVQAYHQKKSWFSCKIFFCEIKWKIMIMINEKGQCWFQVCNGAQTSACCIKVGQWLLKIQN